MSVNGEKELRENLERVKKEAIKLGRSDGKRDRGKPPKSGSNLPNWTNVRDQCETVEAELRSSLDQRRTEANAQSKRIDAEITETELAKGRKQADVEELKTKRDASTDAEASALLDVHISKEKTQVEGLERRLSALRQKRDAAHSEGIEAERQAVAAEGIFQEEMDVVMAAYESSYRQSQSKGKGLFGRVFGS